MWFCSVIVKYEMIQNTKQLEKTNKKHAYLKKQQFGNPNPIVHKCISSLVCQTNESLKT